jgi:hypothetical protein
MTLVNRKLLDGFNVMSQQEKKQASESGEEKEETSKESGISQRSFVTQAGRFGGAGTGCAVNDCRRRIRKSWNRFSPSSASHFHRRTFIVIYINHQISLIP